MVRMPCEETGATWPEEVNILAAFSFGSDAMGVKQVFLCTLLVAVVITLYAADDFTPLFPKDGVPEGWVVTSWNDLSQPPENEVTWTVKDGVLTSGAPRGTWLVSKKEYGDFILEFEFKLGEQGNSGCALRTPLKG